MSLLNDLDINSESLQASTTRIIKKYLESTSREQMISMLSYFTDEVDAKAMEAIMGRNKPNAENQGKLLPTLPQSLADISTNEETKDIDKQMNMRIK